VSGLVIVKEVEHLLDVLAGVLVTHFRSHHVEELGQMGRESEARVR
jgi:hypothetical protein